MTTVASPRKSSFTEVLQRVYGNLGSLSSSSNSSNGFYSNNLQKHKGHVHESEDDFEDEDGTMELELVQIGAERTKNVLILMSDTGGGHRASAEAIREAFKLEYGDEYNVCDLGFEFDSVHDMIFFGLLLPLIFFFYSSC
jgi:1,2-diacylglycerol 3-beta-galactosyltransferase